MRQPTRLLPSLALALLSALLSALLWPAAPARALDCSAGARQELQRLSLAEADIDEVDYVQKINPTDKGPQVLGVRAWVRLRSCSGHLVIDMTRSCFVRQSYTRGDCRVDGTTPY